MLIPTVGQERSLLIRPLLKPHETHARIYSNTNQQASLQLSYPHPASAKSTPTIRFTTPNHQHNEFFNRINQLLTTPIHLFRKSPLAAPESPPTFAVPKRQTDQRKRQKHPLRQQIEWSGTPTEVSLSYPPQAPRFISQIACTSEKSHRTFAARFDRKRPELENRNEKNLKIFAERFESRKKFLPLHSQNEQR
jgi:hypothetical protein